MKLLIVSLLVCCIGHSQGTNALMEIIKIVQENHIKPVNLNNETSGKTFDTFLNKIDPEKMIFTKNEVAALMPFKELLDDEFLNGSFRFLAKTALLFEQRIKQLKVHTFSQLNAKINLNKKGEIDLERVGSQFALNEKEALARWDLLIRKQFLEELYIIDISENEISSARKKEIALKKTKTFYHNYFNELETLTPKKLFDILINSYLFINDYQSSYFSTEAKKKWDEAYNRSFVGVGISIETTIDYPVIRDVLMRGPAWESKKIQSGDKLTHVSINGKNYINLAGKPIKEVITYLKGREGTNVSLKVKSKENITNIVKLTRARIDLPKTMAFVLENETSNGKTGYIRLLRFYRNDMGSASHVSAELERLNNLAITNLIFDLRDNQGGSVYEAVKIIGYFLNGGPVMHAKYANGNQRELLDQDSTTQFKGKLIVLVNKNSSSASELFAGTIQDYGRGIIVGSQTFGKGTIQRFFDVINTQDNSKEGDVKLTIGSFYTGMGRSTQYNGITPDIVLPSTTMFSKTGERAIKNALRFESLMPYSGLRTKKDSAVIKRLNMASSIRINKNTFFNCIRQEAVNKKSAKKSEMVSLTYKEFKHWKSTFSQNKCRINSDKITPFNAKIISNKDFPLDVKENWESLIEKDQYLYESFLVMSDYELEQSVSSNKK